MEIHKSVETFSTNFRRDFRQRSNEVDNEVSVMNTGEKRKFKVCFEVNGKEISNPEITEWLGKHREPDPAMIEEEGDDDDSDVKGGKDTANAMLHATTELEVFFSFSFFYFSSSSFPFFNKQPSLGETGHFFVISFSAAI